MGIAVVGATFCLALMAARLTSAISFAEPLQLVTSGVEYESLFAVWKKIQGLAVYTSRFEPPFSMALYNWAFYDFYGLAAGAALRLFSLGDAWLPTVARLVTLVATAAGTAATYVVFARALEARDGTAKLLAAAFAVFVMTGPLVGFWAMTLASDIMALTLEISAVAIFMALYPAQRWRAVILAATAAYLAWSFKQSAVYASGTIGLFLLLRREWGPMFLFAGLMAGAWTATLLLGQPQYVKNVLFADYTLFYSIQRLARNLGNLVVKSGPSLFLLAALAVAVLRSGTLRRALWRNDRVVLGLAGCLTTSLVAIPISSQSGGAENYYFALSFFLSLLALAGLCETMRAGGPVPGTALRPVLAAGAFGWGTLILSLILVFSGVTGVIDVRHQQEGLMKKKACLAGLPAPLFVHDPYLSLPWMVPNAVPFVLSYTYFRDRDAGKKFKDDGIGGLVRKRQFATIALAPGMPPDKLDGAPLDGYVARPETCAGMTILLRRDAAPVNATDGKRGGR